MSFLDEPASTLSTDRLPCFQASGHLPSGVHDISIGGLVALTCFNDHRREMWNKLACFLVWPNLLDGFSYAYVGGGFLSSRANPADIDLVLQTAAPYSPDSFQTISRFFVMGLEHIYTVYGIHLHFWMENAPSGLRDYRSFFQYVKPSDSRSPLDVMKGVVRLDLQRSKLLSEVRNESEAQKFAV